MTGPFAKTALDPAYVREQELLMTRGFARLLELAGLDIPIMDYPLPEVRMKLATEE